MSAVLAIGHEFQSVGLSKEGKKRAEILCEHVANFTAFSVAAKLAGVPYSTASMWRLHAPEFGKMLADAEERRTQLLEVEAWRRALAGSDTMLIFMLKAGRPAIYRERGTLEITGPGGAPLELSDPQRAARIAAILQSIQGKLVSAESVIDDAEFSEIVQVNPTDHSDIL